MKKTSKKRAASPESEILKKARESNSSELSRAPFISIRPNGSAFASINQPFKPVVIPAEFKPKIDPVHGTNVASSSSVANKSSHQMSKLIDDPMVNFDFDSSATLKEEEEGMLDDDTAEMPLQNICCEMTELQRNLHDAVDYLITIGDEEQRKLKAQLCNHPYLLFTRIQQLSAGLDRMSGKKARSKWVNYSNVLAKFPTGYGPDCVYQIEESGFILDLGILLNIHFIGLLGKLKQLFKILVEAAKRDDEKGQNRAQFVVASSFPRTLAMLGDLLESPAQAELNYSIYKINPNMPSTTRHEDFDRAAGDDGRKLVLLNLNTEHLHCKLFHGTRLIFYDFDNVNDNKLLARWKNEGAKLKSAMRLITLGTFEVEKSRY